MRETAAGCRRRERGARPAAKPLAIAALFVCVATAALAGDWPHWRGPNRNDVVDEPSGWDGNKWPLGEADWSRSVGEGCTSPIVVDGRLYTMGWQGGRDRVFCLDAATGKELWQVEYEAPRYGRRSTGDKGTYSGPSSTPAFDPETGYLYTLSLDGDLHCWDTARDGEKVWHVNFYDRYNVGRRPEVARRRRTRRDYGYTTSPLVYGEWIIAEVGDDEGNLMAFDKRTGRRAWVSRCKDEAGHTGGPVPMKVAGVPCLAVLTLRNLLVVRLDDGHLGETLAEYPWTTHFANNIATPAVHGNSVLITSAYNHYAMCRVDVTPGGARKIWENENPSGVCSPIVHEGRVYWAWRGVHCVDFATGQELWRGGKVGAPGSCILTADERLIVWADHGDLTLVETAERSPSQYKELAGRRNLSRRDAWPHVVLADGRLYCKDRSGNIKCFGLP